MDASVENDRLPRLRSEARIRTYKRNNERLATSAKRRKISTKTLDDLPDEVLLKIYAFLSIKNLVRCSGVSKRIRRVCHDESLWQKINLYGKIVPSEFIEQVLANGCTYLNLQNAQIHGTLSLPDDNYQVKYLNLSGLIANMENVQELLLSCSYSIEKLSLSGLGLNENMINAIFKNENLTVLDLSKCSELTIEYFNQLPKCDKLTELNLCHIRFIGSSQWDLVSCLVNNLPPNLEKFGFNDLFDREVKILVNRCKKLTELDMFGASRLTIESITYIAEKLPELVKLDVCLSTIRIDSMDFDSLLELKCLSNLKILNIDDLYLDNHLTKSLKSQLRNTTINTETGSHRLSIAMPLPLMHPDASIEIIDGFWDITAKPIDLFDCVNLCN
jgi:hypothetical protein